MSNNAIEVMRKIVPTDTELLKYDRWTRKAVKHQLIGRNAFGFCPACQKWYNQGEIGSVFCPTHKRLLTKQEYR